MFNSSLDFFQFLNFEIRVDFLNIFGELIFHNFIGSYNDVNKFDALSDYRLEWLIAT